MTDTRSMEYWMNWRFLVCAVWVLSPLLAAAFLIWRNERQGQGQVLSEAAWRPCLKHLHPAWLLAFRLFSLCLLLALFLLNLALDGQGLHTLFYYTVWTFFLLTLYFAIGSVLSIHGCLQYRRRHHHHHLPAGTEHAALILPNSNSDYNSNSNSDREHATYVPPSIEAIPCPTNSISNSNAAPNSSSYGTHQTQKGICSPQSPDEPEIAGFWGYLFQIIYQTNAGAVMLTDCVFWLVIFPFRAMKDYDLNLLLVGMHSVNVVLLIGDIILNSLRFPWFRIAYFLLFTGIFVIFQWVVHACVSMWWPYPFMDLSSPLSPLWYLVVAALHLPCYAVFPLLMKLKHSLLSRFFPHSYHLLK